MPSMQGTIIAEHAAREAVSPLTRRLMWEKRPSGDARCSQPWRQSHRVFRWYVQGEEESNRRHRSARRICVHSRFSDFGTGVPASHDEEAVHQITSVGNICVLQYCICKPHASQVLFLINTLVPRTFSKLVGAWECGWMAWL